MTTKRKPKRKPSIIVIVRPPGCPHCGKQGTARKLAGAYKVDNNNGCECKYFRVRCKSCSGCFVLREIIEPVPDDGID